MSSLWEIATEFENLSAIIDQQGGEVTQSEEDNEKYILRLLTEKTDGCVQYIQREDDLADLARQKIKELTQYAKARDNRVASFKKYIHICMTKLQTEKLEGNLYKFTLRKKPDNLIIEDETAIPAKFIEVVPESTSIKYDELKKHVKNNKINGIYLKPQEEKSVIVSLKT